MNDNWISTASTSRITWEGRAVQNGLLALIVLAAATARLNYIWNWEAPYEVHHIDENLLPYESVALLEGVTPRELGWPASTSRLLLSGCYAVDLLAENASTLFKHRPSITEGMETVCRWSYRCIDNPRRLFQIGRGLSACLGILQVVAAYWAIRRWSTARAGLIGSLSCAVAPVAVEFSQFVLTDILGVLLVTVLMGLLGGKSVRSAPQAFLVGILLGLAVATKYHFAIWLVPALTSIWMARRPKKYSKLY